MNTYQILETVTSKRIIATLTAAQIAEVIRVGGGVHDVPDYKSTIAQIRSGKYNYGQVRNLKKSLPAMMPSERYAGTHRGEGTRSLVPAVMLDIDGKDNPTLAYHINKIDPMLPGTLIFNSPKADAGRKVLIEVGFATESEYNIAAELLKTKINQMVKEKVGIELVFDERNVLTNACYLSYDPNAVYEPAFEIAPIDYVNNRHLGGSSTNKGKAVVVDLSTISPSSTAQERFDVMVKELIEAGVDTKDRSLDEFCTNVTYLAKYGITVGEICKMMDTYILTINGGYRNGQSRKYVVDKINRYAHDYIIKNIPQAKAPAAKTNDAFTYQHHLSEKLDMVWALLQKHKSLYLSAPTGGGKTTLIKRLAELTGLKVDLYCPTTALADQQHDPSKGIYTITGDCQLGPEQVGATLLATCYESVSKVVGSFREAKIAVVDEAHELATEYGYRYKTIQELDRCLTMYDYVIYLSGTLYPVEDNIVDNRSRSTDVYKLAYVSPTTPANYVSFTPANPKAVRYDVVKLVDKVKDFDYFINTVDKNQLQVFYKQSVDTLTNIKEILTAKGYRCLLVNADAKHEVGYQEIIHNSTLDGYDVLLCTSLLRAGVNILDTRPARIVFGVADLFNSEYNIGIVDYVQFAARWRNAMVDVKLIHTGYMGEIHGFNPSYHYGTADAKINELLFKEKFHSEIRFLTRMNDAGVEEVVSLPAKAINRKNPIKEKKVAGVTMDTKGAWVVCKRFIQFKRYQYNKFNVQTNIRQLRDHLGIHGWVFGAEVDGALSVSSKDNLKKIRTSTKQRKLAFAEALLRGDTQTGFLRKDEKEIRCRYDLLTKIVPQHALTPEVLVSDEIYERWYKRGAYRICSADLTNGYKLQPDVALWYVRWSS